MDISIDRSQGPLTFQLSGRMDGFGAQQVTDAIRSALRERDREIIFDLGGLLYISSAGLRVLQEIYRKMNERNGTVSLCQVGEFPLKVLKMGGFLQAFTIYPTLEDALAHSTTKPSEQTGQTGAVFQVQTLTPGPARLIVRGDISRIAAGNITTADLFRIPFETSRMSVGIGVIGTDNQLTPDLAGEMMELSGSVIWVPADGNRTADYVTSDIMASEEVVHSGFFQVSLDGPAHVMITVEPPSGPVSLQTLAGEIIRYLEKTYPSWGGICSLTFQADAEGVCSSDISSSLIRAAQKKDLGFSHTEDHKSLHYRPMKENLLDAVSVDVLDPQYPGETLLGCGYIVDISKARERFSEDLLKSIALLPTPSHRSSLYMHLCAAVLHDIPWGPFSDMEARMRHGLENGTLLAMHRLLGVTMIRRASITLAPVSDIIPVQNS